MIFSFLIATSGLKIEDVIAQETMPQHAPLTIDENLYSGQILILSDGSTWEIAPKSRSISETWIIPLPLKVEKNNHPTYPYTITNLQTETSILARPTPPIKTKGLNIERS